MASYHAATPSSNATLLPSICGLIRQIQAGEKSAWYNFILQHAWPAALRGPLRGHLRARENKNYLTLRCEASKGCQPNLLNGNYACSTLNYLVASILFIGSTNGSSSVSRQDKRAIHLLQLRGWRSEGSETAHLIISSS